MTDHADDYDTWRRALAGEHLPAAFVDLDALAAALLLRLAAGLGAAGFLRVVHD